MLDFTHITEILDSSSDNSQFAEMLGELVKKRGPLPSVQNDARRYPRFHYPATAMVDCEQPLPAFPRELRRTIVLTKNLSRTGLSLLHSVQFYPGEVLRICLPNGQRRLLVVRCVRLAEDWYETGGFFL